MRPQAAAFTKRENAWSIRLLRAMNILYSRVYHHVDVRTPCQLPLTGPAILVCNHLSGLDPVLVQAACPRIIRWMMAREYYQQKGLKWLLDAVGIIPVDRSGRDLAATRAALTALENGYVVGVFPEGRIETGPELLPFQPGIVLLAAKSGAPIYPAYMEGSQRGKDMLPAYRHRQRASLAFGSPIILTRDDSKRENIAAANENVRNSVEILRQLELLRLIKQPQGPDLAHSS